MGHVAFAHPFCGALSDIAFASAARAGAAQVKALDQSGEAIAAANANAAANGVQVSVSTTPVAEVDGQFDLVFANILAPALISMADDLRRVTSPTGRLVLSGILADHHEHVLQALAPMVVDDRHDLGDWTAVVVRHP